MQKGWLRGNGAGDDRARHPAHRSHPVSKLAERDASPRELSAATTVALFAGMALLGIASVRTRALPGIAALVLLLVGVLTVPLIFLAFPLGSVAPNYLVSDLPLVLAAVLLILVGIGVQRRWREA